MSRCVACDDARQRPPESHTMCPSCLFAPLLAILAAFFGLFGITMPAQ